MPIDYEKRKDGIAIVTMNRPEKLNALGKDDLKRLTEVFYELRTDPSVLVAIITGAGNRSFTTGMDLSLVGELHPDHYKDVPEGLLLNMVPYMKGIEIWKPIIAAVNGHAIALGACMLLGTDIRIASPNATYALNEVLFADIADGGALARLPRQIPFVHAMKIMLTGETIKARRDAPHRTCQRDRPAGKADAAGVGNRRASGHQMRQVFGAGNQAGGDQGTRLGPESGAVRGGAVQGDARKPALPQEPHNGELRGQVQEITPSPGKIQEFIGR